MRTKRSDKYFVMSNDAAQDPNLSFASLGLLSYCLSMPEEWDFYPKVISKERNCGRDRCYGLFNELIQSYHCIRIRRPNPYSKNLYGEVEYEIYDETSDCKKRIAELEKTDIFMEHGGNLKKCFRHTDFQDTENRDTEKPYILKETDSIKETIIQKKQQQATHQVKDSDEIAAVFFDEMQNRNAKPATISSKSIADYFEAPKNQSIACNEIPLQNLNNKHNLHYRTNNKSFKIHECLKDIDIPLHDKEEISRMYYEPIVRDAIAFALQKAEKEPLRSLAATIKFAAKRGLKAEKTAKKLTVYDELCEHFTDYDKSNQLYNNAYCFLNQNAIAFRRGLTQQEMKLDKYFSWDKFKSMCDNFQIKFERNTN